MATKNKTKLISNFPEVKRAAREVTEFAVRQAVSEGQDKAKERIDSLGGKRGYNLDSSKVNKQVLMENGKIWLDEFYWRWFEYGTVHIAAMPFLRPAHRAMRKTFMDTMKDDFEGWVKRRARVH
jgi:HK97 gp10 family phage protein